LEELEIRKKFLMEKMPKGGVNWFVVEPFGRGALTKTTVGHRGGGYFPRDIILRGEYRKKKNRVAPSPQ